ncbi:MAG: FAD-dependent oxidoreductase [Pirellulaceae bacterium]|nr:FAD-dependent oxidoreductase [Pirellulaceae bacterium]
MGPFETLRNGKRLAAITPSETHVLALTLVVCATGTSLAEERSAVLVEAESFRQRGGWVIDQQAMDQMGSPYLLAHGLGRPVEDAVTTVRLPKAGVWHVWVRTWDWVSPWNASGAPGRFQVLLDGKPLDEAFGTRGAAWGWQGGQAVRFAADTAELTLRDLTGFEGRCDAIAFTVSEVAPPNDREELDTFRRECLGLPAVVPSPGRFDLVVTGGGVAGICTAVTAARLGLKVALIQNRPVLGGNSSSEIGVSASGKTNMAPFPQIGNIVKEVGPEGDDRRRRIVEDEENVRLFLNMHVFAVEVRNGRISAVVAQHIVDGTRLRFSGELFADCTGDGTVGFLAGADWRIGREGRNETNEPMAPPAPDNVKMGSTLHWQSRDAGAPREFPECPWAIQIDKDSCMDLMRTTRSRYYWETGFRYDAATETEFIRDYMLRAIYGNWAFLKNRSGLRERYANLELSSVAYVLGKRESRRLMGDVILTEHDIRSKKPYEDACLTSTWGIDLHTPHTVNEKHFPGNAFICHGSGLPKKDVEIYPIPYRCLYSRNIENLFMAGRSISVTHVALGQVRVQNTTGMMGEVVGRAASICARHGVSPRGVYEKHLVEFKELLSKPVE